MPTSWCPVSSMSGDEWMGALDVQVDMIFQSSVNKPASHLRIVLQSGPPC